MDLEDIKKEITARMDAITNRHIEYFSKVSLEDPYALLRQVCILTNGSINITHSIKSYPDLIQREIETSVAELLSSLE